MKKTIVFLRITYIFWATAHTLVDQLKRAFNAKTCPILSWCYYNRDKIQILRCDVVAEECVLSQRTFIDWLLLVVAEIFAPLVSSILSSRLFKIDLP